MQKSHTKNITSTQRGLFVILIDQSGSMEDPWADGSTQKSVQVAETVNKIIGQLLHSGKDQKPDGSKDFKDRFDIACLGYGTTQGSAFSGTFVQDELVSSGELFEEFGATMETVTPYVLPRFDRNGTDMYAAFEFAERIVRAWIGGIEHADSFPPMVIHLTDGENGGADPTPVVERIKALRTNDGEVLVWNLHIASLDNANSVDSNVMFVESESDLRDVYARKLCVLSSRIPNSPKFEGYEGKYAFGYNLSVKNFVNMMRIGTIKAA